MKSLALLPASLIFISSMACSPRANEAFLADIKKSEAPKETPIVLVLARKRMDAEGWNSAQHAKLNELVELLASRFGFRIEVSHAKAGPSANSYSFIDFMPPTLQGLTFKRENLGDGFTVEIRPDYAREVVLDEVIDAQSGIKKHVQGPNASTFAENVERIRKDNQYKRAWIVSYHFKQSSSLPQDSPFWDLCTKLLDEKQLWGKVAIPNAEIALTENFWKSRGQGTTLASLASYRIVAFEAQDGKLAKTEGWTAFGVE